MTGEIARRLKHPLGSCRGPNFRPQHPQLTSSPRDLNALFWPLQALQTGGVQTNRPNIRTHNKRLSKLFKGKGLERWLSSQEHWLLFQGSGAQFPAHEHLSANCEEPAED